MKIVGNPVMRKILIVMHDMGSGGAQRSLLSFLSELEKYRNSYEINLLLMKREGLFYSQIPSYIKLVEIPKELICMYTSLKSKAFWKICDLKSFSAKIKWQFVRLKHRKSEYCKKQQLWWSVWQEVIPELKTHYDVAISYMQGSTNYYVIEKVRAAKKVMWIHTKYSADDLDVDFDRIYYSQADQIVTVSNACSENFIKVFPNLKAKVTIIENITSNKLIWQMAQSTGKPNEYDTVRGKIIVSIGRLSFEKGFDLALDAVKILKSSGCVFKWFIIGKGPLLNELLMQRKKMKIVDYVEFLGERANPYVYIHYADIFVQTSRLEGKSIVLDEAKILKKPIVVTKYATVTDNMKDKVQGLIVNLDGGDIAHGIKKLIDNNKLCLDLAVNLADQQIDNGDELEKYLHLLDN